MATPRTSRKDESAEMEVTLTRPRKPLVISRNPFPLISKDPLPVGQQQTIQYQNKDTESSEVKKIEFVAPPEVQVAVRRTVNKQPREVHAFTAIKDLLNGVIDFREAANKTLTIGRSEIILVDVLVPAAFYVGPQVVFIKIDKDQVYWRL